ncbi:hypothetical protein O181_001685 [Austropuccinia psidii MF-1]|uniref:Uncharacterized protein n=1 Tax=Austropuccinia psidii MF-1 TaxID=1389203 RepID=A0A9Q3BBH8_9BASI|nr:hypothetical protein [Austropuccinia psidii MF-1]
MINLTSNSDYCPEVEARIPLSFMEIDRKRNFRFSELAPGSGTSDTDFIGPEETEKPILVIISSELHNKFFNSVNIYYAKYKQFGILMSLLQQKYMIPEPESQ